jgi:hypothetical protein
MPSMRPRIGARLRDEWREPGFKGSRESRGSAGGPWDWRGGGGSRSTVIPRCIDDRISGGGGSEEVIPCAPRFAR